MKDEHDPNQTAGDSTILPLAEEFPIPDHLKPVPELANAEPGKLDKIDQGVIESFAIPEAAVDCLRRIPPGYEREIALDALELWYDENEKIQHDFERWPGILDLLCDTYPAVIYGMDIRIAFPVYWLSNLFDGYKKERLHLFLVKAVYIARPDLRPWIHVGTQCDPSDRLFQAGWIPTLPASVDSES